MLNALIQLVRERGKSKFDGCDRLTGKVLENLALSPDTATRRYYASQMTGLVALQDIRYWETWPLLSSFLVTIPQGVPFITILALLNNFLGVAI